MQKTLGSAQSRSLMRKIPLSIHRTTIQSVSAAECQVREEVAIAAAAYGVERAFRLLTSCQSSMAQTIWR